MEKKVAIQGHEGSFHHQAARYYFGRSIQTVPCSSFKELVKTAEDGQRGGTGVMAIENSIAGSILNNYTLMQKSNLQISGEIYLSIRHNLLVNPGVTLADIQEVQSHPMALLQCADFLEQFPQWKLVESQDTAYSAHSIHQHKAKHIAAIASDLAAQLFGLEILASNIHSMQKNFTRFLVLDKDLEGMPEGANKASIYFHAEHHKGSLAAILIRLAASGINLSKLQSVPVPGTDWEYGFHADLEFTHTDQYMDVMQSLPHMTKELRVFGVYKKGQTI
ncbi:MAG: prephenate dehydratase [Bacteroidia bacterium]|jgi:prephenate dehydratase|nr:prephenate dehydratase [Bacteroidia bacterium]MCC6768051.1 prephenate dehydratase [Bacteroidia bacterium]